MLWKLVVPLGSKASVDLSCNRSSSSLSPLVVLSLLPRRQPPRGSAAGHRSGVTKLAPAPLVLLLGVEEVEDICFYVCEEKDLVDSSDEEEEIEMLLPF